ncbi:MAG: preprotein translocase subunit SecG [Candidatus Portnoybacteria bacterium CG10_big_fil_rev_8_21_14_0_10_44_7]|uniref:Protein-export membrane protein SecG n=1 Tax=Candidatus Portnoybacteria bacterium CG10_big_fil_rev_8_21_14_0_10_44_7 TaxID=1974816 RepID=A0A2M8KJE9_9BACT|nr:MAG: preprotein translocase subunit SecG [Candidatus Portnoybacteria bacterium CG10_big_fil_rev_8_21_14_0_10_44_7]
MNMDQILLWAQTIVSALLIAAILLQQRGAGASAITGGSDVTYYKKRGFDKVLFISTLILGGLFLVLGIINLVF